MQPKFFLKARNNIDVSGAKVKLVVPALTELILFKRTNDPS